MLTKIAIPTTQGVLSAHFGHCEKFAVYTLDQGTIIKSEMIDPPAHEPGSHPRFLKGLGCTVIIAGGMGSRAQALFAENGISVIIGVPNIPLEELVQLYHEGKLESGTNLCDH